MPTWALVGGRRRQHEESGFSYRGRCVPIDTVASSDGAEPDHGLGATRRAVQAGCGVMWNARTRP